MSIKVETSFASITKSCVLSDRVLPITTSPIEYARGNGSNVRLYYAPLQLSKIHINTLKCVTPKKTDYTPKSIPTVHLK
jgi:hypothetical protein